ncbi:hypothetical protein [Gracilimonas sp.]|uniref:DUF6932 family protein n=1 Tax=Gracilimonas sp. TaxID=1974203 RepID=UPI0025C18A33|nr:hypothetical protein [Gracilimonas sp.]
MSEKGLKFTNNGLLPPGDYELTFRQLRKSILVSGPAKPEIPNWDKSWRSWLVNQAEMLVKQLWQIGITDIYLDGSFVEAKPRPNDIDGYFECDLSEFASGHIQRQLNLIDPHKIWTWNSKDRKSYSGFTKKQLPMWHKYRIELYPHFGQPSGITDKHGNQQVFPAAFRKHRASGKQKGIIKVIQ